jgi:pimeloyl-ACP methyl ester carboxylesterase
MAADVRALLDHLGIGRADVMGYSMGARICAFLALEHGERFRLAIFGGLGIHLMRSAGLPENIAEALEAPSLVQVHDPYARMFRAFADQTHSDLRALAACIRGSRQSLTVEEVARIQAPVLVAVGSNDLIAGSAHELAALMPDAHAFDIPERDHMLSVGDRRFKDEVLRFLRDES